ncbi:low affinity iron permease family protein [Pusillimonas sp.]|uniref:low affinity iron permease family protein n=1 Tax=Pusillimonas sp. TaxID=3040095 RepID=UPI0037CBECCF
MEEKFRFLSERIAHGAGTSWSFVIAIGLVLTWAVSGPIFGFSDTWQLIINTGTTIITFLMVFLIQNTQNRDAIAVHLKLDELLRVVKGARTGMINLDQLSNAEIEQLRRDLEKIGREGGCDLASIEAQISTHTKRRQSGSGQSSEETHSKGSIEVEIQKEERPRPGSNSST